MHVSPPSSTPATPPRRPSRASDWSTLFKMASSPHKIRFISIPGKGERRPFSWWRAKNLPPTAGIPLVHRFSSILPSSTSRALSTVASVHRGGSSILTLKGVRTFGLAFYGQHFLEEGFKPPPLASPGTGGVARGGIIMLDPRSLGCSEGNFHYYSEAIYLSLCTWY